VSRTEITEEVVDQLVEVVETDRVDRPVNWMGVQGVAHERGLDALVGFVVEADATTYYEALRQAADRTDADVEVPDPRPRREWEE
jgi:hypothetical protein